MIKLSLSADDAREITNENANDALLENMKKVEAKIKGNAKRGMDYAVVPYSEAIYYACINAGYNVEIEKELNGSYIVIRW